MKSFVLSLGVVLGVCLPNFGVSAAMPDEFKSMPLSHAIEEGKRSGKPTWLYLSRTNCAYCNQLEGWVRGDSKLREAHRSFVYAYSIGAGVNDDDGKGEHNELRAKFKVFAYPVFVFFDKRGEFLCKSQGYDRIDVGVRIAQLARTMQAAEAERIAGAGLRSCDSLLPR